MIVIGATNRVDAIDPALRRPGRFDREFAFSAPTLTVRRDILRIHIGKSAMMEQSLANNNKLNAVLDVVSGSTTGYTGADLKALVTETALCALRRSLPQLYTRCKETLKIPISNDNGNSVPVKVSIQDFFTAMNVLQPSAGRLPSASCAGDMSHQLQLTLAPLLAHSVTFITEEICRRYAQFFKVTGRKQYDVAGANNGQITEEWHELARKHPCVLALGNRAPQNVNDLWHLLHDNESTSSSNSSNNSAANSLSQSPFSTNHFINGYGTAPICSYHPRILIDPVFSDSTFTMNNNESEVASSSSTEASGIDNIAKLNQVASLSSSQMLHNHILPAVFHDLLSPRIATYALRIFTVSFQAIMASPPACSIDENVVQLIVEALRCAPAILYIPNIDKLFSILSVSARWCILEMLSKPIVNAMPTVATSTTSMGSSVLFIVATLSGHDDIVTVNGSDSYNWRHDVALNEFFHRNNFIHIPKHSMSHCRSFFHDMFLKMPLEMANKSGYQHGHGSSSSTGSSIRTVTPDKSNDRCKIDVTQNSLWMARILDPLPVISEAELAKEVVDEKLTPKELKRLEHVEEKTLRNMRSYIRNVIADLGKMPRFKIFLRPVDPDDFPDYYDIITKPMDLSTVRAKLDSHDYITPTECFEVSLFHFHANLIIS